MNTQKEGRGFTIIEVVLVLAIAGLIFLMVFIALPALQRSQRDSARKQEMSTVLSQVTSYQSNNRGASPAKDSTSIAAFAKYLDTTASDTGVIELNSGTTVTFGAAVTSTTDTPIPVEGDAIASNDNMLVVMGAKCGTTAGTMVKGTNRQAAAAMKLENGDAVYCQTN